jgi:2'-phosphotransferase
MQKHPHKDNKGRRGEDDITKISKTMCYLLRHQAVQHGLAIETSGFVNLDDLLNCQPMKKLKVTKEMIFEIVKSDNKGRYELINRPPYFIRAVQGHSLKSVKDEDILDPIHNIFEYPVVVHGTYYEAWEMIRTTGLNRMSRNCIHFSIGYKKEDHVLSGMRNNCQVYIELNAIQAHHSGIKFFISKNKVVLTPGLDGVIPSKFIKKAIDHQNKYLYAQNYEIGILINFNDISANEIKGNFSIINLENKSLIHSENYSNFESFNLLSKFFVNKELITKPFIIIISKQFEDSYINLIQSRQDEIENIAFYSEYIVIDDSEAIKELKEMNLSEMNAMKIKRIEIDYKRHYEKLHKSTQDEDEECRVIPNNHNDAHINSTNVLSEFRLTKKILSDPNISKNYLLLFLNFEEEDILTSIDYILIPDGKLENLKNSISHYKQSK